MAKNNKKAKESESKKSRNASDYRWIIGVVGVFVVISMCYSVAVSLMSLGINRTTVIMLAPQAGAVATFLLYTAYKAFK